MRASTGLQLRQWVDDSIKPELWVQRAGQAVAFYAEAFSARVLHQAGRGTTSSRSSRWATRRIRVAAAAPDLDDFSPRAVGGATSRTLLVADDPDAVLRRAIHATPREVPRQR